jgi:copper chaperone CopZ
MEVMNKLTLELPTLYGDHHVVEVRRLLLAQEGVEEVYASSAFQLVEVTYDPTRLDEQAIRKVLEEAGYLGAFTFPEEKATAAYQNTGTPVFFRNTAIYENTRKTVSFAQQVKDTGRPLWPCPGMGALKREE